MKIATLLLSAMLLLGNTTEKVYHAVTLTISNIQPAEGVLHIDIYRNAEKFMYKAYAIKNYELEVNRQQVQFVIKDLEVGTYALCLWHDANRNGYMDKNLLGIPKEGYGFSNNPRCVVGPPDFKDCTFQVEPNKQLHVTMNN